MARTILDRFSLRKRYPSAEVVDRSGLARISDAWRLYRHVVQSAASVRADHVWSFRQTSLDRETAAAGLLDVVDLRLRLPGSLRWDCLVADMRLRGWPQDQPVVLSVADDGKLSVSSGHERLAIAMKLSFRLIPVRFHFGPSAPRVPIDSVTKSAFADALDSMPEADRRRVSAEGDRKIAAAKRRLGIIDA